MSSFEEKLRKVAEAKAERESAEAQLEAHEKSVKSQHAAHAQRVLGSAVKPHLENIAEAMRLNGFTAKVEEHKSSTQHWVILAVGDSTLSFIKELDSGEKIRTVSSFNFTSTPPTFLDGQGMHIKEYAEGWALKAVEQLG